MGKPITYCSVDDCGKRSHGHGMCAMHYLRWRRYGRTFLLENQPRIGAAAVPHPKLSEHPREYWIAWAAGFFDGEGCICIQYRKSTKTHYCRIHAPQVNPAPCRILQGLFGGNVVLKKEIREKSHHRQRWIWEASCRQAEQALKDMLPFLIVKREEAELAIEFQSKISRAVRESVTDEERERREGLRLRIQELKWREYKEE